MATIVPGTAARNSGLPIDLEIRISTPWSRGGQSLEFVLNSPAGTVDFFQHTISGTLLQKPEQFQQRLFKQLDELQMGYDLDGTSVSQEVRYRELTNIGHDLYQTLFPPEMKRAYRRIREKVRTLLIVSDEPWIPWEMLQPCEFKDDDFLCMKHQMSRWLTGERALPIQHQVQHLLGLDAGSKNGLKSGKREIEMLEEFCERIKINRNFPLQATAQDFVELLEQHSFDLLHFVGHGRHSKSHPGDATITLNDRSLRARQVSPAAEKKLLAERPIVFFNACQVGRLDQSFSDLDGWATRWIRRCGCSAFLAPLWSVHDGRALRFAEVFYEHLGNHHSLGEAVLLARHQLRKEEPDEMTWLTYSLYSHPDTQVFFNEPPLPTQERPAFTLPKYEIRLSTESASQGTSRGGYLPSKRSQHWVVVITLGLILLFSSLAIVKLSPFSTKPDSQIEDTGNDHPLREELPPPPPPPSLSSTPSEHRLAVPSVSIEPLVSRKIGISILDSTTHQPDRIVTQVVTGVLMSTVTDIQTMIPDVQTSYIEQLLAGDFSRLPGENKAPWGAQYLLVATSNQKTLPQANPRFTGIELTMSSWLIDTNNRSIAKYQAATHTGMGISADQALRQAAERCLTDIINSLQEEQS